MVHLSELSWSRVMKADEAVSEGQKIKVKVLKISKEKGRDGREHTRISLSLKDAMGNPWDDEASKLVIGDVVEGKVVRLAAFGAFVEVLPGIEGLVHVSEMSWGRRVNKPEEVVKAGDMVKVKIKDVNLESRRVSLSMRDAEGDPWADVEERFPVGSTVEGRVESHSKFGLFVVLAPGITGLLPEGIMRSTKTATQFQGLDKDAPVELEIHRVDAAARNCSGNRHVKSFLSYGRWPCFQMYRKSVSMSSSSPLRTYGSVRSNGRPDRSVRGECCAPSIRLKRTSRRNGASSL